MSQKRAKWERKIRQENATNGRIAEAQMALLVKYFRARKWWRIAAIVGWAIAAGIIIAWKAGLK